MLLTTRNGASSSKVKPPEDNVTKTPTTARTVKPNAIVEPLPTMKTGPPKRKPEVVITQTPKRAPIRDFPYLEVPALNEKRQITSQPNREPVSDNAEVPTNILGPKPSTVYKSRAPVETEIDIEQVLDGILATGINLTLRDLTGVSTAIREGLKKQLTRHRRLVEAEEIRQEKPKKVMIAEVEEEEISLGLDVEDLPEVSGFAQVLDSFTGVERGTWVAKDPIEVYLETLGDKKPEQIYVSQESEKLRAISARINNVGQEECLLDGGSQIVSMAKRIAVAMGLTWDPSIRINMQSANRQVEASLGLARNVPFTLGGITIFLQVHILEDPAYNVLLGRPFDSFTSSKISNEADGNQMLELTDPNTKRRVMVPTYVRGTAPISSPQEKGF